MNVDVAKAINTSYVGRITVLNTIAGWQVAPSQTVKPSTSGKGKWFWTQPLGSFFPLGFLTPPDREPMVDVVDALIACSTLLFPFSLF
jgi:hypothetical protein